MSTNTRTLRLYWRQIRRHKISFFAMLICIPLASLLLDTVLPFQLSKAVGTLESGQADELSHFLLLAGIAGAAGVLINIVGFQSMIWHESRVRARLVDSTLSAITAKDYSFFQGQKIGALTGKFIDFINATVGLQDLFIIRTLTFVANMTIGIYLIFINSWAVALLVLGLIVVLLVQIRYSLKLRSPLRKERKRLIGEQNGAIADTISGNLTVKTFANEAHELGETRKFATLYQKAYFRDFSWMTLEGSLRHVLMVSVQIVAVAVMARLYMEGQINLGIAVFVVAYLQRIAGQLFLLGDIINGYDRLFLQAAPMTELLETTNHIVDTPGAKNLRIEKGKIELKNISYAYEDTKNNAVINNISLTIPAGQKVGIVGKSGAGKTTLTKLLLRFDDPTAGVIAIDNQDIARVSQDSLRRAIAYVPQDSALFHRSLRENIAYGKLDASEEEIIAAAKKAHALEFIEKLPHGLDTVVGERGAKLSGGQRQRIAIARAILKDAPILLLDEATSALDSESEKLIQSSLDTLMEGRTSLVIAHRLSTIAKLDRIIVMDNGRIIEDGTHQQLITQNGTYAALWQHQSGGFIEE